MTSCVCSDSFWISSSQVSDSTLKLFEYGDDMSRVQREQLIGKLARLRDQLRGHAGSVEHMNRVMAEMEATQVALDSMAGVEEHAGASTASGASHERGEPA